MPRAKDYNEAWNLLFEQLDILEKIHSEGTFLITAKTINEVYEARLMAKFDTIESLPAIFRKNNLNINALKNGEYVIFFDENWGSFSRLSDRGGMEPIAFTAGAITRLDTLTYSPKMSESAALDFAHHCGLLAHHFKERELVLTTRGRFYSHPFELHLGGANTPLQVKGVQVEVDAGMEGTEQFILIEAKSSTRKTFNIRQLYYPLQHFRSVTDKTIRTVLICFSNGVYHFTEFQFSSRYFEYRIVDECSYEIKLPPEPGAQLGLDMTTASVLRDKVPVPQANDLNKVLDTLAFLSVQAANKHDIAAHFEFDERQGDYYANAVCFLQLARKEGTLFTPTPLGHQLIGITDRQLRNEQLAKAILATPFFGDLMTTFQQQGNDLREEQVMERLKEEGLSGNTLTRRATSVRAWIKWLRSNGYFNTGLFS